ncbi:DUF7344 domain-containing protein [Haloprofundus halophilus]|uniref:DUF7344 domain-containing protein n=1 Tax=Haloprofundus halophilus TaxID=2283527 RepID=UPI0013007341|nr:hypothetical protein [Haloprofundus halophilus]
MTTKTSDTNPSDGNPNLSPSEIFSLLSNERRRYALYYLTTQVGAIHLGELAEQLAIWEGEPTMDHYHRIYVGLLHNHLSALIRADVVEYDAAEELISISDGIRPVRPYLELSESEDMSHLDW